MKQITKILSVAVLAYALTAISSSAQVITFDENGHGNFGGTSALPFTVGPDPSGGIAAPVLIYTLPFVAVPGDVGLLENGSTSQSPSDLVRYFTPAGANFSDMIFYSDFETNDVTHDLADSGLPNSANAILITETGPENNNGAVYGPAPGAPGAPLGGGTVQYQIISDVPEPGTLTLAACGGGLVLAAIRRRRQGKV